MRVGMRVEVQRKKPSASPDGGAVNIGEKIG